MTFNFVDVLLGLLIVLNLGNGYRRGFVLGGLDLAGWVLGLLAALRFYEPVARWLAPRVDLWSEMWDQPVAFIVVALFVALMVHLIASALLRRVSPDVHERPTNQALGLLPGLANGLITAAIISAVLMAVPLSETISERMRESVIANRLAVYAQRLESSLRPVFGDAIARTLNLLTVQPESNERVDLPFTVSSSRPRPDLESQMLNLVNGERIANRLQPLAADPELTEVARRHSSDMFARGYFAHDTPEGATPFDRMRDGNVRFLVAGENLALAPTVSVAHTGLMNSPGHRANILRPQFGRLGIGIMDGGMRGLMVSQEFRN